MNTATNPSPPPKISATRRAGALALPALGFVLAAASCVGSTGERADGTDDAMGSTQAPVQSAVCPQPSFTLPGMCGLSDQEARLQCDALCQQGDEYLPPHPGCTMDPASLQCSDIAGPPELQASYGCQCFLPDQEDPRPPPPEGGGGAGGSGGSGGGTGGQANRPSPSSDLCPPTHLHKDLSDPLRPVPFMVEGGGHSFLICCNGPTSVTPTECCCRVPKDGTPAQQEEARNLCDRHSGYPDCIRPS